MGTPKNIRSPRLQSNKSITGFILHSVSDQRPLPSTKNNCGGVEVWGADTKWLAARSCITEGRGIRELPALPTQPLQNKVLILLPYDVSALLGHTFRRICLQLVPMCIDKLRRQRVLHTGRRNELRFSANVVGSLAFRLIGRERDNPNGSIPLAIQSRRDHFFTRSSS